MYAYLKKNRCRGIVREKSGKSHKGVNRAECLSPKYEMVSWQPKTITLVSLQKPQGLHCLQKRNDFVGCTPPTATGLSGDLGDYGLGPYRGISCHCLHTTPGCTAF